jgi:UDP-N-acetylmuramoyl-L-alanyl-D-glutamate--2,6-diaminopimelate ligase
VYNESIKVNGGIIMKLLKIENNSVDIDYANTFNDIEKLLIIERETRKGRIITVFGCEGNKDKNKRKITGMAIGIFSDYCIITSYNSGTEDPKDIISDIEEGMRKISANYEKIIDRRIAIEKALKILRDDDLLIIAGEEDKDYQFLSNSETVQ